MDEHGPEQLGVLVSPTASAEELYLAQKLAHGLGCRNIDHRTRQIDFRMDGAESELPVWAWRSPLLRPYRPRC